LGWVVGTPQSLGHPLKYVSLQVALAEVWMKEAPLCFVHSGHSSPLCPALFLFFLHRATFFSIGVSMFGTGATTLLARFDSVWAQECGRPGAANINDSAV
jgi:hypothetical protein